MRTRYFSRFLLSFTTLTLIIACSPAQTAALLPARSTVMPDWQYVATATPVAGPGPVPVYRSDSGLYLTARLTTPCLGAAWLGVVCSQPYAGEFVVTAYNGAEVARVMTSWSGQAMVNLPPGRYIVGVRTAGYYPQAAPVAISVYAGRYTSVWFNLNAGPQQVIAR
jgi:hypothetical protein